MFKRLAILSSVVGVFTLAVYHSSDGSTAQQGDPPVPEMKFNDVTELAPGVFFRYSSISATDPKVPFGGCNNIWVVFKDYVFVVDANFPKEAGDVIAAIKKTTKKPIKYVLDTHHHGDHAYGNCIWARQGAQIIASKPTTRLLKTNGPKQWAEASTGPMGRDDLKKNELKQADITFEDRYVLDDGTQRVEIYAFGHSHTSGDAVAYLPRQKILCTGDACVNGAFNFMGHSNSASSAIAMPGALRCTKAQSSAVRRLARGARCGALKPTSVAVSRKSAPHMTIAVGIDCVYRKFVMIRK